MPASRNPFFIRTAEQAESDAQFLNFFSLSVLDLLPESGQWDRFLSIESAPGGGKSTLLRLFTPTVLTNIVGASGQTELRDLVQKLQDIDAIDARGVRLLGVLVNCREDYSRLVDLPVEASAQPALFRALLHARLALLTIRATLQLGGLSYPADVAQVRFEPRSDSTLRRPDARTIEGVDLFNRARAVEELIVDSLNSFAPRLPMPDGGLAVDDVFQLLNTHRVLVNGRQAAGNILIMFDDAHLLNDSQRAALVQELERHDQSSFASWMAMRLRALEPMDLVSDEATRVGRERLPPVRFDRWSQAHIEKWLIDVGDRRAKRAQRDVPSFEGCLADSLEAEFEQSRLASAADAERGRAYDLSKPYGVLYRDWIASIDSEVLRESPLDQAVRWSQLQILMARRIGKMQREFDFEALAPVDVDKVGGGTLEPAKMFMAKQNALPYYFGAKTIAQLASSNVEQFLSLSATLFDRLLNSGNLGRRGHRPLGPSEQHRIILAQSRAYVDEIRTSLPYGQDVYNLVIAIAKLCREESLRPNVPITPGVTGVSIQESERDELLDVAVGSGTHTARLINALASAIAHNVLSVRATDRQRDENRVVFYLNRLICPAFDLPLGYGGYKPQRVSHLADWAITGEPSQQRRLGIA